MRYINVLITACLATAAGKRRILAAVAHWFQQRFNSRIDTETVVYGPSVIYMVSELIRLWSMPGDGVVVHTPAYDAFYKAIEGNARHVVPVAMEKQATGWQGNMAALEAAPRNRKTKYCCCAARKTRPARSGRRRSWRRWLNCARAMTWR